MANDLEARRDHDPLAPRLLDPVPASYSGARAPGGFDGSRLVQFVRHNYKLFFAVLAVVLAIAALLTLNQTKVYSTKATVMLDQRKQQVVQGLEEVVSNLPADSSVVDTEVQLLSSAGMAYQVARTLNLVPATDPQQLTEDQQQQVGQAVRDILEHRSAQRVGLTYIIDIYYNSSDPARAQQVANAFAQTYIASQIDVRVQANERARTHLQQEIAKLTRQVKLADQAVAQYKAANRLNDTSVGGTLTEQEISSYNQALAVARAQSAEDAQRLAASRAQLRRGADAMGDSMSPGLGQLRAQETAVSTRVADLAARYGPNHPDLVSAKEQLAQIRTLINAQSNRSIASLETQSAASAGRAGAIAGRLATTENALQRAGGASVRLHELQLQLDAPQKLLEAYQQRLSQISTQSGTEQADARLVSLAPYPLFPSSPSWFVNMVLGLGAGVILGLIAVLVRQVFAVGVSSGEEVETTFGVDFLAALPALKNADDMAIVDKVVEEPLSPFAEAVRSLAAGVLFGHGTAPRVLAISSALADAGKTTTSIALGRVMAMRGRRVLIIDCDIQRPAFFHRFGIGNGLGLVDVLIDDAPLERAIVDDSRTTARFLPLGRGLEPGQSLDEGDMARLLDRLRRDYDDVILDLPPVLQVAETRIFASLADATLLLARWKNTSKQAIDAALATLIRARAPVIGIALTRVPASSDLLMPSYYAAPQPRLGSKRG